MRNASSTPMARTMKGLFAAKIPSGKPARIRAPNAHPIAVTGVSTAIIPTTITYEITTKYRKIQIVLSIYGDLAVLQSLSVSKLREASLIWSYGRPSTGLESSLVVRMVLARQKRMRTVTMSGR